MSIPLRYVRVLYLDERTVTVIGVEFLALCYRPENGRRRDEGAAPRLQVSTTERRSFSERSCISRLLSSEKETNGAH